MTDTKSFSLPTEITEKLERFGLLTRRSGSSIALQAFEDFFSRPEVQNILKQAPISELPAPAQHEHPYSN